MVIVRCFECGDFYPWGSVGSLVVHDSFLDETNFCYKCAPMAKEYLFQLLTVQNQEVKPC